MGGEDLFSLDEAAPKAFATPTIDAGADASSTRIHFEDSVAVPNSGEKHCVSVEEQDAECST